MMYKYTQKRDPGLACSRNVRPLCAHEPLGFCCELMTRATPIATKAAMRVHCRQTDGRNHPTMNSMMEVLNAAMATSRIFILKAPLTLRLTYHRRQRRWSAETIIES